MWNQTEYGKKMHKYFAAGAVQWCSGLILSFLPVEFAVRSWPIC